MNKLDDIDKLGRSALKLKSGRKSPSDKLKAEYKKSQRLLNKVVLQLIGQLVRDIYKVVLLKKQVANAYKLQKLEK